jgi:FKBP-type peptidyl-prolyl cis-trans isomerase SlyD
MVVVKEIHDEHVLMDHNHPLAGQDVDFKVSIKDIRNPTEEELNTGIAAENQQVHNHNHNHDEVGGAGGGCGGGGGSCGCHS